MLTFKPQFKQLLFSLCVLVSLNTFSQTTIASQNFDTAGLGYTVSNGTYVYTWNYTASSTPNSLEFAGSSGTEYVLFNNVDISSYTDVTVKISFSSYLVGNNEDLWLDISYNNGATWAISNRLVNGNNPGQTIDWGNIDGDGQSVNSNPYTVNIPNGTTSVKVRVSSVNIDYGEYFNIDDLLISGTLKCTNPAAPTAVTPNTGTTICSGASVNLDATSAGNTIYWYTQATGGSSIGSSASGANFSVSPTSNTTYYAEARTNSGGCISATRTATALITVNATPTITGTTPASRPDPGVLTLAATASSGTISWYANLTGGSPLATGPSFTTPSLSTTTTYYVSVSNGTCTSSPRTPVVASIASFSEVIVSVNWPSGSNQNSLKIYTPSGVLISSIRDTEGTTTTNYLATFNLGCLEDLNNYYFIMYDSNNNGWDGTDNITITVGGTTVINQNGNAANTAGVTVNFNVSGGGCTMSSLSNAPGGVAKNLQLWLKSNKGVTKNGSNGVTSWVTQANGSNANVTATGQEPTFRDDPIHNVNFNPVIDFDNGASTSDSFNYSQLGQQFLTGNSGFYTQDIFVVVIPDTAINSSSSMDIFCADSDTGSQNNDGTGTGFGSYSQRFNNEVLSYAYGLSGGLNDGFGVAQTVTGGYDNVGIINSRNNITYNSQELYYNGTNVVNTTSDISKWGAVSNGKYWIGRSEGWSGSLNGRVTEIITYSSRKNDTDLTQERNRIQSYLAIKYGITLGTNGTSQDYVASDGTLIWDVNTSTPTEDVFNYNITGIGRDDVAELNQKQSKSVHATNDITIGHGDILATNNLNTNNFAADKSYLVWGNNNGSLTAQTPVVVNLSAGISGLTTNVEFTSIGRTWKVVKKGTVGMAKIAIPQTMLTATITPPGSFLMFISDEPTFSPTSEYRIMNLNGSNLETYYEFTSSKKFITFGYAPEKTFTRSIYFDGTKDYLNVGNKLDLNTSFTISAWVKRSNTNASIVSKRNNTYANGGYDFKINASGNLEMSWKNGATQTITSSVVIPSNKWHHVAVVYNGTQAKLYIDGVEDVTQTKNLAVPITNSESFLIAAADGNESNTTSFFQGNIDEVRIWNTALSQDQLRFVMNQEIENDGTKVSGSYFKNLTITPSKNDINAVDWASLKGYYPMSVYTFTNCKDASGNGNVAAIKKLNTVDWQTAPLPYVSIADTDWDVSSTWQNGSVQTIPGSASIVDATKTVDWNIVQISSNVILENSSLPAANFGNRNVLGLLVDNTKKLEVTGVNPTTTDPYSGTGNGITISHYLGLNGKIDLQGESQLIQTLNSDLNVGTNGVLERDQQGVGNKYWYNDWSSPVYSLNDGLNYSRIIDVLRDGTNASSPGAITYVGGYDGAVGPPITLSTYWMYKYANHPEGSYSLWEQIGNTGKIYPGQGFLMKGTGAAADQNYVFVGKPNNGNFDLNITSGYDYLLGNPYASAIDSWEFIDDNPNLTGPLYFWEHYGGTNHNLKDYQAGYATLTKAGGVTATSGGVIPAGVSNLGTSTKIPGRFIPVGQGFFVVGSTNGQIHFKNSQRIFFKEAEETVSNFGSVFMKGITKKTTKSTSRFMDNRQKIRIGFEGAKVDHRQLLLTIDENASDGVDRGYEAEIYEVFEDDMYWVIQDKKYVIQATNAIENNKEILLGVKVKETGTVKIKIDELENEDVNMQLFLKDSLLQKTYNLKENPFEQEIEAGEYVNRFYLVFKPIPKVIEEDTEIIEEISGVHIFMNNQIAELQIQKDAETNISQIKLVNYLGQNIKIWNQKFDGTLISLPIKLATGVYVVQMKTEKGIINKKIIIE
ncbi:LamG-like jellyroll fold domain-containing protein [Lutibacter maritimus]|uniref:Por secretion system C-terminal sorting domain-containing protein n=1 Tax=Lutibacter maritimus TaxID=593133 RepID=A0A1I6PMW0_9FLAO|nr:LamG-like jellyroll fold domain-containing protein [Lutibacter maritimus]SFS41408.1 Por secretion system C-terminal sorting domain-containing protein [Lutibacter maritimus]